ncbi:hypothetical protein HYU22_04445 [Candidatus Woesearchaeota archaeon]|nr:hypothetical protein [Candidatus Woesearchaeota archaeon]
MKPRLMALLFVVLAVLIAPAAWAQLDIVPGSVMVNGVAYVDGVPVDVSLGDTVTVDFTIQNNFVRQLGHVETSVTEVGSSEIDDLPQTHRCRGVDCNNGYWVLTPGETRAEGFTFTVPYDVDPLVNDFVTQLSVAYDNAEDPLIVVGPPMLVLFHIVRDDNAIEIIDSSVALDDNSLTCDPNVTLTFDIVNTGSRAFTPELQLYNQAGVVFDPDAGEFVFNPAPAIDIEQDLGVINPGERRTETVTINTAALGTGQHTLYFYIVNPYFDAARFFVGDEDRVSFTKSRCLVSFDPNSNSLFVRTGQSLPFSVTLAEPGFGRIVHWLVDGVERASGEAFAAIFGVTGDHTVTVNVDANAGETHTWDVTVSNTPRSNNFLLPGFDESQNLANYRGFTVENSFGRIVFDDPVDLTNIFDLDPVITISRGLVAVDSTAAPGLGGRRATVTLFDTFNDPLVLFSRQYNGGSFSQCVGCVILASAPGQFRFTVPGFSTYRVVDQQEATIDITAISFVDVNRGETVTVPVTITNLGTFGSLTNVRAQLVGVASRYAARIVGNVPSQLLPGQSVTVNLQVTVPSDEDGGMHSLGTFQVTSNEDSASQPITLSTRSFLIVDSIKVDGSTSGNLLLDDVTSIEVRVRNNYSEDMEDVSVTVTILDVNDDDISEECDAFDLDSGDDDKCEVDFDLRRENPDEDSYTIEIEVEGEAADGTQHRTVETKIVSVKRERHDIVISQTAIGSTALQCLRETPLRVTVENVGRSDEDDVQIRVYNTALGIDLMRDNIELDKFSGSDNEYQATFNLEIPASAAPGTYPIIIEAYRDGSVDDSLDLSLQVQACTGEQAVSAPQVRTVGENLVGQLQEQLSQQVQGQKAPDTSGVPTTTSFRESRTYVTLLGVLVVLMIIAVIMAVVVMVARKK